MIYFTALPFCLELSFFLIQNLVRAKCVFFSFLSSSSLFLLPLLFSQKGQGSNFLCVILSYKNRRIPLPTLLSQFQVFIQVLFENIINWSERLACTVTRLIVYNLQKNLVRAACVHCHRTKFPLLTAFCKALSQS